MQKNPMVTEVKMDPIKKNSTFKMNGWIANFLDPVGLDLIRLTRGMCLFVSENNKLDWIQWIQTQPCQVKWQEIKGKSFLPIYAILNYLDYTSNESRPAMSD